jgi:phage tail protein X
MKSYTTKQGDMWDTVAKRVYPDMGGELLMTLLIDANPDHRDVVIFPGGVILAVPEVEIPAVRDLPPWKR